MGVDIALIGCSKRKLNSDAFAIQLYRGQLFRAQLAYARKALGLGDASIFILSAKFGLVGCRHVVKPYDRTLSRMTKKEREKWGMNVGYQLGFLNGSSRVLVGRIYVMAGKLYREPLQMIQPVRDLMVVPHPTHYGYAQQTQWYKQEVKAYDTGSVVPRSGEGGGE